MRATCLFAVVIALSLTQGAAEAAAGACAPRAASIVARGDGAYVYRVTTGDDYGAFFLCSRKFSGRTKIADYEMDSISHLTVRGRFAAFSHKYFNNGDTADSIDIEVVDLRRHRSSAGARVVDTTPKKHRLCDYPETSEFCYFSRVGSLFLTRHGSVAFGATLVDEEAWPEETQACKDDLSKCPDTPHHNVIYRLGFSSDLKKMSRRALDHVKSEELSSLNLAGNRMRWTGHGEHRSASIR